MPYVWLHALHFTVLPSSMLSFPMPKKGQFAPIPVGARFGRLVVLGRAPMSETDRESRWRCRCDCGQETTGFPSNFRSGNKQSCGCLLKERLRQRNRANGTHHMTGTATYRSWCSMHRRCRKPGHKYYYGRGIKVCRRWARFENFLADMGERPSPAHSLDRKNANGHYEPSNCRWATAQEQTTNRRTCWCPHCAYHRTRETVEPSPTS